MGTQSSGRKSAEGRGIQRTTREDWLNTSLDTLISEGVDQVKVLNIADKLRCSRSSFYWYFKNRAELLEALLDHWESMNTHSIVKQAQEPADTITSAMVNVFKCWTDPNIFNSKLDFAIREWSRRSGSVRRAVDISDDARITAIAGMFQRFGYPPGEATVRARVTYYSQVGYYALDVRDSALSRAKSGKDYLLVLTGREPSSEDLVKLATMLGISPDEIE